jgi:hypothetical protein
MTKPFREQDAKGPDLSVPKPGEIHFRLAVDLFLSAGEWKTDCRTARDTFADLTWVLQEGKIKKRVVVKGFEIVPYILTEPLRIPD